MLVLPQLVVLLIGMVGPVVQANQFHLPNSFLGSWIGKLDFSMFGPYDTKSYLFSISQAPNGDYLFENNIVYDDLFHMGYQRFYVEGTGDTASSLWYCGKLTNYSDVDEITGNERLNGFKALTFPGADDTSVTFCLDSDNPKVMPVNNPFKFGCSHCDCANWTISFDKSTDKLVSQLSMSGSEGHTHSKHVWVTLERAGPAPVIADADMPGHGEDFSCDFEEGGRDSEDVDRGSSPLRMTHAQHMAAAAPGASCPHLKQQRSRQLNPDLNLVSLSSATKIAARKAPSSSKSFAYDHCYVINAHSDYRIAWTVDFTESLLHISISSSTFESGNDTYVAIGFRPMARIYSPSLLKQGTGRHMNFGMEGADIVAGSVSNGLRTLYAELYTGPPVRDDSLKITETGVELLDGRVVLTFTRPLVGGYLVENFGSESSIISGAADIIWAVGVDSGSDEARGDGDNTSGCEYHSNTRGIRFINWEDPTIAMPDDWKC